MELKLNLIRPKKLIQFFEMFKSIDKHVLMMLEMDGHLKIKITNPKKSAVKCTRVRLEDVFDYNPDDELFQNDIIIPMYTIENVIKVLNAIDDTIETSMTFYYEIDDDGEYLTTKIKIENENMLYDYDCANKSFMKVVPDNVIEKLTNIDDFEYAFELDNSTLEFIKNFSSFDSNNDISISLIEKSGTDCVFISFAKVNSYNYNIIETKTKNVTPFGINKEFLTKYLDKGETYKVYVNKISIILYSNMNDSRIVFAKTIDEKEK